MIGNSNADSHFFYFFLKATNEWVTKKITRQDGHSMIAIAQYQLNGSGDTQNVYHFIDMSIVLILGL